MSINRFEKFFETGDVKDIATFDEVDALRVVDIGGVPCLFDVGDENYGKPRRRGGEVEDDG